MKNTWGFLLITLLACQSKDKKAEEIELPFYNEATFTPEWVDEKNSEFDSIHTIAPFSFENQNGQIVTNDALKGKVYVANFFFTVCVNVCPKMTNNLLLVQEAFKEDDRVQLLSHTVMPWVDSVKQLKEYAELNNIDGNKWQLLTGDQDEIYSIARESYFADEGFGKSVTDPSDFLHTEKLILIDQKGRIRGVYNGTIRLETKRMIEDIGSLLES